MSSATLSQGPTDEDFRRILAKQRDFKAQQGSTNESSGDQELEEAREAIDKVIAAQGEKARRAAEKRQNAAKIQLEKERIEDARVLQTGKRVFGAMKAHYRHGWVVVLAEEEYRGRTLEEQEEFVIDKLVEDLLDKVHDMGGIVGNGDHRQRRIRKGIKLQLTRKSLRMRRTFRRRGEFIIRPISTRKEKRPGGYPQRKKQIERSKRARNLKRQMSGR